MRILRPLSAIGVAILASVAAGAGSARAEDAAAAPPDDCRRALVAFQKLMLPGDGLTCDQLGRWLRQSRLTAPSEHPPMLSSGGRRPAMAVALRAASPPPARRAVRRGDLGPGRRPGGTTVWTAGLTSYRLGDYDAALAGFERIAADASADESLRARAAYWAARAARALGLDGQADGDLRRAASSPSTFYGMLAQRELQPWDQGSGWAAGEDTDPLPIPRLDPQGGFTLDRALVYAIVRNESGFNPEAVSRAGAVGLMQLMPGTAAFVTGDGGLRADASPLREPSFNLRIGQDYFSSLRRQVTGGDLYRAVAAYNGGPELVSRTERAVGRDDPLLTVESLPYAETRDYVRRVVASYWTYQRQFGEASEPATPASDAPVLRPASRPPAASGPVDASWWALILSRRAPARGGALAELAASPLR